MTVTPIRTRKVRAGEIPLITLLQKYLTAVPENSILAITSKVVSLCEGRVAAVADADKEMLIQREATYYLPKDFGKYGYHFTITNNMLASSAGIDTSNGDEHYVLWPRDPQQTANQVRRYLKERFKVKNVGVVITDSTSLPFKLGIVGTTLSHSGFRALNSYVGKPDLFGRPFEVSRANIANGLAASAVLAMGEGSEQTPLVLITDIPFVGFQSRNPNTEETASLHVPVQDDLFAPFFVKAPWRRGKAKLGGSNLQQRNSLR